MVTSKRIRVVAPIRDQEVWAKLRTNYQTNYAQIEVPSLIRVELSDPARLGGMELAI